MSAKIYETGVTKMSLDSRGFLRLEFIKTSEPFDLKEAEAQIKIANQLCGDKQYKILVDTRNNLTTPSMEAKKKIADVNMKLKEAIIVESLGNRIIINVYRKLIDTRYPSKVFKDEEKAIEWLLSD
ncbi:hypothetical protein K6119_15475 [Paracrocinitomix mangrovi]|uniref:DUF7793 family protein n=1 Tax=Paracrocinitomix mangrovi TaxID=2862509 RepID=UPI001C8E7B2F|nr:hypothetical protein [Paracrocinitomix mangrovi]UKN01129.1 hypothetical protein K6119_15475 [Paracrocinitomix mangrovi]